MNDLPTIDFLIIGQGLAGSILAWTLKSHGSQVLVCDPGDNDSASRIAAGIVNPIIGKRFVKAASTDLYLRKALAFYKQIGEFFAQDFYQEKQMLRLFNTEDERANFTKRITDPKYQPFIGTSINPNESIAGLKIGLGGYYQQHSGVLDCARFLKSLRAYFDESGHLVPESIDYTEIKSGKTGIRWRGTPVRQILCCEGFGSSVNPWFAWLPFQASKGEILSMTTTEQLPNSIVNKGYWLLPLNQNLFKLGATYQWNPLDNLASQPAKNNLLKFLDGLFIEPPASSVLDQRAAIRPGTLDKSPFIGRHPEFDNIILFNGFGSTGVLRIPYYAERLTRHLLHSEALPAEANIQRYNEKNPSG